MSRSDSVIVIDDDEDIVPITTRNGRQSSRESVAPATVQPYTAAPLPEERHRTNTRARGKYAAVPAETLSNNGASSSSSTGRRASPIEVIELLDEPESPDKKRPREGELLSPDIIVISEHRASPARSTSPLARRTRSTGSSSSSGPLSEQSIHMPGFIRVGDHDHVNARIRSTRNPPSAARGRRRIPNSGGSRIWPPHLLFAHPRFVFSGLPIPDPSVNVDAMSYEQLWDLSERLGSAVPKGVSPSFIHQLPSRPVTTKDTQNHCTICLCQFELDETIIMLPCTHGFHMNCIKPWLQRNSTCPVCRVRIS